MNTLIQTSRSLFEMAFVKGLPKASFKRTRLAKSALCLLLLLVMTLMLSSAALAKCYYEDTDHDGYGDPSTQWCGWYPWWGGPWVTDHTDCDDNNANINPGMSEICGDGLNNNCLGGVDEGCVTWYRDSDGDNYGDPSDSVSAATKPAGYVLNGTDCDDNDGSTYPGAPELCDGKDNDCDGIDDAGEGCLTWYRDADNDGYGTTDDTTEAMTQPAGYVADNTDCDDGNANIHPGATEICDGQDNNCDNDTDEGCQIWYEDGDGDGFGNAAVTYTSVTQPAGYVADNTDCDDSDAGVYPGADEVCDGRDNNCDGTSDEGCLTWYQDSDGDGFGNPAVTVLAFIQPSGYVPDNTDCDDTDPLIYPGASEIGGDGIDNNCDGQIDEGATWYQDSDGDGYGNPDVTIVDFTQPAGYVADHTDCDDTDPLVHPGAVEICEDETDNDCDGDIDDGCLTWYEDNDGDGYGNPSVSIIASTEPGGYVSDNTDCNDNNAFVHPNAYENCEDGIDNNCDGLVDENCTVWYQDSDGDGYGNPDVATVAGTQPAGYVTNLLDCDDGDAAVNPDATEVCDGVDNNCNGVIDEGCEGKWYQDIDDDGYGNTGVSSDTPLDGYVPVPGDCNDNNAAVHPGAKEVCGDGLDNNCVGGIDEGCLIWYQDSDLDGYGNPAVFVTGFVQPPGYIKDSSDCNDMNSHINPAATEVCDGVDNDCDGFSDEGCADWYQDSDGDGYGNPAVSTNSIVQPVGYVDNSIDCDDTDAAVNPGVMEVCNDGIDNDCDGETDEGCITWYQDNDGDGWGNPAVSEHADSQPAGYVENAGDCDDNNPAIHPGVPEVCGDGLDNNCSGGVDEGCMAWYLDNDGDTWGSMTVIEHAATKPFGYVNRTGDCDDNNAAVNPDATEVCDGQDNDCDGMTDEGCRTWYQDNDGDTWGSAVSQEAVVQPAGFVDRTGDCDDTDAAVNPDAVEVCDGIDNDCDGKSDEGCVPWYQDLDGDGYGNPSVSVVDISQPPGYVADDTDCDDTDAAINPGMVEVCGDGIDNNCSGDADEGCLSWYEDSDGDTWGSAVSVIAKTQPAGYVARTGDCDDTDATINPDAPELCDGSVDDNCDGFIDEGCLIWYEDDDGDNFGNAAVSMTSITEPPGYVLDNADCDDTDPAVNPDAVEICDGIDNNCDGNSDEGCLTWYQDNDGDNYGNPGVSTIAQIQPAGYVLDGTDCDDGNAAVHPGAAEICDGVDNNCDGNADEGCLTWYRDGDGDGYGNAADSLVSQTQPAGYVLDDTDCDDGDPLINPAATEVCDGVDDEDCDGTVDEGCLTWYEDGDGDGYGNGAVSSVSMIQPAGYVLDGTDCDDTKPAVHPGATEICDGLDNNCNLVTDEGCMTWYEDIDGDTFGNSAVSVVDTVPPAGYVGRPGDCDDNDAAVNPAASEICGDGIDNDCSGTPDDGCMTWYIDYDGDGYGTTFDIKYAVIQPPGYVAVAGDCVFDDPTIHPGAPEVCGDGKDNDCSGTADDGCVTWYKDGDGDNYGDPAVFVQDTVQPPGYVADNTDCDDSDPTIHPGAVEVCDGIDNNCSGSLDETCKDCYQDLDADGYGDSAVPMAGPCGGPGVSVPLAGDCDDGDPLVNPGVAEFCGDGIDNDCDGLTDEHCRTWYLDSDGDNFGDPGVSTVAQFPPAGYVADNTDCEDGDAAVNPAAPEICGDGIDNNCDGNTDEGCVTWYLDSDGDNFGDPGVSTMAQLPPAGYVADNNDCNDSDAAVHPGAKEICDSLDNNCNGTTDEGCLTWYLDSDGDGFGDPGVSMQSIVQPPGYVSDNTDCEDGDAAVHPGAPEICGDGIDNDCSGVPDDGCMMWYLDSDGDNFGNPAVSTESVVQPAGYVNDFTDCDDSDPAINPDAEDICGDGIDNDCSGTADDGCMMWYLDSDGDNYGDPAISTNTVVRPAGYVSDNNDCDDSDAAVNPGMDEVCGDGIDNDCSGTADDGCMTWYEDADGDGYGNPFVFTDSVVKPPGYVADNTDCNDAMAFVNPGALEVCDGVDNNCDGNTDEGCNIWYRDSDGDGYGTAVSTTAILQPAGYAALTGDCNDGNAAVHPGAAETCDGVDNDCDGIVDEGCRSWYRDNDGDGYGSSVTVDSQLQPAGYVNVSGDCNDADPAVNPAAVEACDGIDNDCDGFMDEGCTLWYQDNDGDGYGSSVSMESITQPAGYVDVSGDCNDADPAINPAAAEVCEDSVDNDCDGSTDEGCINWYQDLDGDSYGNDAVSVVAIDQPAGFVSDNTDCDDTDHDINPGKAEVCEDGIDNDCDGDIDEGCQTWYRDDDSDTYGTDTDATVTVSDPGGYTNRDGDCDDTDASINPAAKEICDGVDNDCDGIVDERCTVWYEDLDGDGYGSSVSMEADVHPPGYVEYTGDCDDDDEDINPSATEVCDGIDNDCDGSVDEQCLVWYQDLDGDNYGNSAVAVRSISRPSGFVVAGGDCDDTNPDIHPFRLDLCDDLDNDCDLAYDEDVPDSEKTNYYLDADGDGFGNPSVYEFECNSPGYNYVLNGDDCDDSTASIHPGAFDICDNGVDEDCSAGDRSCGSSTTRGCADLTDVPLETQVESAPPIVMFLLDNSGSMGWDVMCAGEDDGLYNGYSDSDTGSNEYWEAQYSGKNNIYYDPTVKYTPWPGYPQADTQKPRKHPDGSPTTDLDSKYESIDNEGGWGGGSSIDVKVAHYYTWSSTEQRPYLVFINNDSVTYYKIDPPGSQEIDPDDVTGPVAAASVPDDAIIPQAWEDGNKVCSAAEAAKARQNFANWYQYYRTRMLTANNTLAKVVANVNGIEIGVTTINVNSASGFMYPVLVDNNVDNGNGHNGPQNRQDVIDFIFSAGVPNGGTPLRSTFKSLGNFFDKGAHDSRPSPWASAADGGECQMAFIIMMTDGYYNGANPNVSDTDGDDNSAFDGPPFGDAYGQANTLADIAMNYYERDLATDLADNVPTTATDTASHQHVVTYSISFGVIGNLDPKGYIFDLDSSTCASGATCTAEAPCSCVPYWPYIPKTNSGCPEKIDDLYHAAVNGRGKYFATSNVQQLSYALSTILSEISDRRGSGASVAVNTQALEADTLLFQGFYNSANWSGDLTAWAVNPLDGSVADTMTWSSANILDNRDLATDPRQIFTYNPDTGHGVKFELGNLSDEQKEWLGDTDDARQDLIDYLTGDRSLEMNQGGYLRDRDSRLGDIVHSAPVHVLYNSGEEYLFVGGNDGMLHCFNAKASGGNEIFAHIPSLVYENLYHLTDPYYDHLYYVDSTPYVDSQKLLVCGLGAGGKGYFALDVSNPTSFSATDVLWEYPSSTDDNMGFSFSKPVIVPHQAGRLVIFGNGYDSENGRAVLYVLKVDANNAIDAVKLIDTKAGSQSGDPDIKTGCNGLSDPLPADVNYDNQLDYIYAGDLQGNLWKFDFTGDTMDTFKIFYGSAATPKPLFKAEYGGVPQPIVAKPGAMRHCLPNRSGYLVVFGTGQFFAHGDFEDTSVQTIYGIWDWADELEDGGIVDPWNYSLGTPNRVSDYAELSVALGGSSPVTFGLLGQSSGAMVDGYAETSSNKLYDRYRDPDGVPNNGDEQRAWFDAEYWQADPVNYTGMRYLGWFFDLPNTGERVIADTTIRAGLAIMVSLDPSPTPCKPGGNSILMFLTACDGSKPADKVLDTNDDGKIDENDGDQNRKELTDIFYKPVILDEYLYFNEEDPEIGPSENLGVAYWRFLKMLHPNP